MPGKSTGLTLMIDGLAANFGGTAYAGVQVAEALAARPDVGRTIVVARPDSIIARGVRGVAGIQLIEVGARRPELAWRVLWEAVRLPALVRQHQVDGLFVLSGMLPRKVPCVVIGLQANPTVYEDPKSLGASVRRAAVVRTARRAVATYVPSQHVVDLAGDVPGIRVVPLGVDRERFRPDPSAARTEILCVADFYEHKGHAMLIDAYAQLGPGAPPMRFIGNPEVAPDHYRALLARAEEVPGLEVTGRVAFDELVRAYQSARLFVIASDRESFCMPAAEALSAGVPVLANDIASLRETAGPGGRFVQERSADRWAEEMRALLDDPAAIADLTSAGQEHADRFSWEAYASAIVSDVKAAA